MLKKTSLLGIGLCLLLFLSLAVQAADGRRDYLIYYDDPNWPGDAGYSQEFHDSTNAAQRASIAERYEFGIGQRSITGDAIRELHPGFGWFVYNSFQDNYVSVQGLAEHNWLISRAQAAGVDPDVVYMHYYDDTYISLQGATIFVPGWGGGSASTIAEARLPVYYSNKSRIMCNYSDPTARQYYKEYMVQKLENYASDGYGTAQSYYSGIFWDNCQPELYNTGRVISGGHVLEHPTHARIDSLGSNRLDWWYQYSMKPFMQELMDTLLLSESWMPDGTLIQNMLNTAGNTRSELATDGVCTHVFQEFSPSITRHFDRYFNSNVSFDALCVQNGVHLCYSPNASTTVSNGSGSYTKEEVIHGNTCWFYISCTDSSLIYQQTANGPSTFSWEEISWCGSMDYDVGAPLETFSTAQTGTDPSGYSYKIYKRTFERAIVYLRPRGSWNQDIDEGTAVTVTLDTPFRELYPDGTIGSPTTTISMRNAQGKIMIPASGDLTPPGQIQDLDVQPGDSIGSVGMIWTAPADDGYEITSGPANHYVIKYYEIPITGANWDYAHEYDSPPDPISAGAVQSFVMTGLTPGELYYVAIRAYDENGNPSVVSNSPSDYVAGIKTPAALATEVSLNDRMATLSCDPVTSYYDPIVYDFALIDSATADVTVLTTGDTTGSRVTVTFADLSETATYYWECRALAVGQDSSLWSAPKKFRLTNIAPDPPTAYSPEHEDTLVASGESFVLTVDNGFDSDGPDPLVYEFEILEVATQTLLASAADIAETDSQTTWTVPVSLSGDTEYAWRSRCNDGVDYSPWMDWTNFMIAGLGTDIRTTAVTKIIAYPNPVHFTRGEYVTFRLPAEPVDILIQSVSGETVLVRTGVSNEWQWLGQNASGNMVSVGVYSWFVRGTNQGGKIMVKP